MIRAKPMTKTFPMLIALAGLAACGDTTNTGVNQLDFTRPTDIAFACWGGYRITNGSASDPSQTVTDSAMPLQACDIRSGAHDSSTPAPVPAGQEQLPSPATQLDGVKYYGFVLEPTLGIVMMVDFDTKPATAFQGGDVVVLDSDPLTPGTNGVAVGEDPVSIATSTDGCYEVTANAGSCDLSVLDSGTAILASYGTSSTVQHATVNRLAVTNAAGVPLRAKPFMMVGDPQGGTIGNACPAQPQGIHYIAYPSCHLVAAVDVSTGTVVAGIQYDANGVPTLTDGNVTCPDECGGELTTPGTRPVALDLQHDPRSDRRLLAIGSDNSNAITLVELGIDYKPLSLSQIALENTTGSLGISRLAITPQIGMGGSSGAINDDTALGGQMQFVYAIASDSTVRVAEVLNVRRECDTQVDPRWLHDVRDVHRMSCLPAGDPATPPRRAGARGPGVEFVADAIPNNLGIVRVDAHDGDIIPSKIVGYYAIVSAANGATYIINIDDDQQADFVDNKSPIATSIPLDIAHQLRDSVASRDLIADEQNPSDPSNVNDRVFICGTAGPDPDATGGVTGGPRSPAQPTQTIPTGLFATNKTGALPSILQVACSGYDTTTPVPMNELMFAAPLTTRDSVFPDLRGLRGDEDWSLTWEGSLSVDTIGSAVDGPEIRTSTMVVDNAAQMRILDDTKPFCDAGVEPFDIVQLRGCDPAYGDTDCPIGYTCFVHPDSTVTGLGACMLADEADRLATACREFLISLRRYTIATTQSGELKLLPRTHELRTSPIDGCTSDMQCQALANYALQNNSTAEPGVDTTAADTHTWACILDSNRKPELDASGAAMKRCLETCMIDSDCDDGTVCQGGTCMEGIMPPQACVNSPQRYELRAGEAFSVLGTKSGYVHPIITDSGGNCVKNPSVSPFQIGRIPLRAPACDPTADPRTNQRPDGTFGPNPCSTLADEYDVQNNYVDTSCTLSSTTPQLAAHRMAPAIQFRSRGLFMTLIDPVYPGDASCIGDRMGNLGNIPLVPQNYQLSFRLAAGFSPLTLDITPSLPSRVVIGPQQSIWVVDQGDFLSTTATTASTRGKVYRVESIGLGQINLIQ